MSDSIGVNRLDRLTSGLMILALTGKASTGLAEEFIKGHVKKEYLARVNGEFPECVFDLSRVGARTDGFAVRVGRRSQ